ncbi:helix-turn-helix domain-containing protein [Microcoleus sp. Pol7_A1]|uniref:helix-turn-helix domain-containing protein n=1 Tax=Microcoleus sp. Pol7_A1 TaxID=2818893 RepID=UPI00404075EC
MVKIVKAEKILQKKSGRPSKLCVENQILMTLSYLREYPTFFHLGIKWGINESNAYRIVIITEKALIIQIYLICQIKIYIFINFKFRR